MITAATTTDQIEALLQQPKPVWILKHSSTCGVSAEAHREVDDFADAHPDQSIAVITVQTHRPVSNWAATRFGYTHQSPQIFLVHRGAVAWCVSHWQITRSAMEAALAKLPADP